LECGFNPEERNRISKGGEECDTWDLWQKDTA
jgi:hypothetical protein